jgi:hypothetical protein
VPCQTAYHREQIAALAGFAPQIQDTRKKRGKRVVWVVLAAGLEDHEQVRLINDQDDPSATFQLLGREQVSDLSPGDPPPAATPELDSLLLFGAGAAGLTAYARRLRLRKLLTWLALAGLALSGVWAVGRVNAQAQRVGVVVLAVQVALVAEVAPQLGGCAACAVHPYAQTCQRRAATAQLPCPSTRSRST